MTHSTLLVKNLIPFIHSIMSTRNRRGSMSSVYEQKYEDIYSSFSSEHKLDSRQPASLGMNTNLMNTESASLRQSSGGSPSSTSSDETRRSVSHSFMGSAEPWIYPDTVIKPLIHNRNRSNMKRLRPAVLPAVEFLPVQYSFDKALPPTPMSMHSRDSYSSMDSYEGFVSPISPERSLRKKRTPRSQSLRGMWEDEQQAWELLRREMEWGVNLYLEGQFG